MSIESQLADGSSLIYLRPHKGGVNDSTLQFIFFDCFEGECVEIEDFVFVGKHERKMMEELRQNACIVRNRFHKWNVSEKMKQIQSGVARALEKIAHNPLKYERRIIQKSEKCAIAGFLLDKWHGSSDYQTIYSLWMTELGELYLDISLYDEDQPEPEFYQAKHMELDDVENLLNEDIYFNRTVKALESF